MSQIPVFINIFNRLTMTRTLADQVAALPNAVPILIDNASTWPPLLDWYDRCPYDVIRLAENVGHHAPWLRVIPNAVEFQRQYGGTQYVVTDCDLDIADCPSDVLERLSEPFSWMRGIVKSGLSLRLDDLPPWQGAVKQWESRWWRRPIQGGRFYDALIDTTFAMYDCRTPVRVATKVVRTAAVRSAPPYVARHMPWYLDGDDLDAENQHYFSTANNSNSWKPVGKGLTAEYLHKVPQRSLSRPR